MRQETKNKLKKFGKGTWDTVKAIGGAAWYLATTNFEEEKRKKQQAEAEHQRVEAERAKALEELKKAQLARAEREALAAKYAAMSKQETIVNALETHDKIKKLESENASLRSRISDLENKIARLEAENEELSDDADYYEGKARECGG